jgi:hypothetical protein
MKLFIKKFFRQKINYLLVLLIGICLAFVCIVYSLPYSIRNYWEDNVLNDIRFRTYFINGQAKNTSLISKLESMDEIEGVFTFDGYYVDVKAIGLNDEEELPSIFLMGIKGKENVIIGDSITEENKDENVMVCPNKYYPYYSVELGGYDKSKEIDLSKFLNKEIQVASLLDSSKTETFKIIDLYEADNDYADPQLCYTYYTHVEELNEKFQTGVSSQNHLIFEIKNIVDENKVIDLLNSQNIYPIKAANINTEIALQSFDTLTKISYIVLCFISLIIVLINFYKNKIDQPNISINKLFGFTKSYIIKQSMFNSFLTFVWSIIVLIPLLFINLKIFQINLPKYDKNFKDVVFLVSWNSILQVLVILVIILFITSAINIIKNRRNNIMNDINS